MRCTGVSPLKKTVSYIKFHGLWGGDGGGSQAYYLPLIRLRNDHFFMNCSVFGFMSMF